MNDKNTEISVSDLKKILRLVLEELDQRDEEDNFKLEDDLYWNIRDEEWCEIYRERKPDRRPGVFRKSDLWEKETHSL